MFRIGSLLAVLVGLLFVASSVPPAAADPVELSGVVSQESVGEIGGAVIDAIQDEDVMGTTTTAADGSYSMVLEIGAYDIRVTPPAPLPVTTRNSVSIDGALTLDFTYTQNGAPPERLLSGVLTDGAGLPVEGVLVRVFTAGGPSVLTDASGGFSLVVPAGVYSVGFNNAGGPGTIRNAAYPEFDVSGTVDLTGDVVLDLQLPTIEHSLVVRDQLDQPVADVDVVWGFASGQVVAADGTVFSGDLTGWSSGVGIELGGGVTPGTGADGRLSFNVFAGTSNEVTLTPPDGSGLKAVSVSVDATVGGPVETEAVVVPDTFRLLSGVLSDGAGLPVEGVLVRVFTAGGPSVLTDASGGFSLVVPAGVYSVGFNNAGGPGTIRNAAYPEFDVSGTVDLTGDVVLDLQLPTIEHSLVVRDQLDQPVADVDVVWGFASGQVVAADGTVFSGDLTGWSSGVGIELGGGVTPGTGADGRLSFNVFAGTSNEVTLTPPDGSGLKAVSVSVDATVGGPVETEAVVVPDTFRLLSGVLSDGAGLPVEGVLVRVFTAGGPSVLTDASGGFSLVVPAGVYSVGFNNAGGPGTIRNAAYPEFDVSGTVDLTGDVVLDLQLPTIEHSLVVRDQLDQPVADVDVVWGFASGQVVAADGTVFSGDLTGWSSGVGIELGGGVTPGTGADGRLSFNLFAGTSNEVTLTPPDGSDYVSTTVQIDVDGADETQLVFVDEVPPAVSSGTPELSTGQPRLAIAGSADDLGTGLNEVEVAILDLSGTENVNDAQVGLARIGFDAGDRSLQAAEGIVRYWTGSDWQAGTADDVTFFTASEVSGPWNFSTSLMNGSAGTLSFAIRASDRVGNRWPLVGPWETVELALPGLDSPQPATQLESATVDFEFAPGAAAVDNWWVYVGTTTGSRDLHNTGNIDGGTTEWSIPSLPVDGEDLFVRLWYQLDGRWRYNDYAYTAADLPIEPPQLVAPSAGSILETADVTFTFAANNTEFVDWWLYVGSAEGRADIYSSGVIDVAAQQHTATGLPSDGTAVYVRLWWRPPGAAWAYADYQFQSGAGPLLTAPSSDAPISDGQAEFRWENGGTAVEEWWLYVGSIRGSRDIENSGSIDEEIGSRVVGGIPIDGSEVHARLWFKLEGTWRFRDYVFSTN